MRRAAEGGRVLSLKALLDAGVYVNVKFRVVVELSCVNWQQTDFVALQWLQATVEISKQRFNLQFVCCNCEDWKPNISSQCGLYKQQGRSLKHPDNSQERQNYNPQQEKKQVKIHTMEKQMQDLGCRVSAIEKNSAQDSKTIHELQKEVEGLKSSLEKALNSLMPKIDSVLSARMTNIFTVSDSVAAPPVSLVALTEDTSKSNSENKPQATSSTPKSSFTTVFQAVQIGDIATLPSHLKSGTSVNQRDEKGFTLLHLAVSGGHEKMVKALLDAGASVNARGPSYTTPLHLAVEIGFINVLEILLHAGADINTQNTNNETPLLRAVRRGNSDAVNFLIENGASLDEQDREGNTALLLAVKKEDSDMTKLLIAIGASLDKCDRGNKSALWYAVERGANEIVKFVCDKGASVKLGKCPLRLASERGNTEAVMLMLQSKNTSDTVAISNALSSAKDVGVALAFEDSRPGILKANEGAEAMGRAVEQGRVHSLKALLDAGVDVNATCIRYKCFVGQPRKYLRSVLYMAKENNQTECIKLLLDRGAKE